MFDRDVPLELHVVDPELIEKIGRSIKSSEKMQVKISIRGSDQNPSMVKVELLSK